VAPFRGQKRTDLRGAFLQFRSVDDARTALRALDGRKGPGGETLRVTLSRLPAVHPNRLWRWACIQDGTEEGAAYLENECHGLGFGTGEEDLDPQPGDDGASEMADDARGGSRKRGEWGAPVGMRGGRFRYWMEARWEREKNKDAMQSHLLWTTHEADRGLGEDGEEEYVEEGQGEGQEQEQERGEWEHNSVPLSTFLRPTRRHQLTNNLKVRDSTDNERAE
jgi:hypothetical protein